MAISLKGKRVAITGASGAMGRALLKELANHQTQLIALTTSPTATFDGEIACQQWQLGQESDLKTLLSEVDILIINHGINVHGRHSPEAIHQSLEVNAMSGWRLLEVFLSTVDSLASESSVREVWINTSEAEVSPAFSPLYELSKRLMGDLITLRRLSAPCVIRKIILGPFKSNLNPIGVMSADWVAWAVVALAQRNVKNIIVTINPLTYIAFPLKELSQWLYFKLLCRG
jgi:monoglucosyldiacylglycerol epimerase